MPTLETVPGGLLGLGGLWGNHEGGRRETISSFKGTWEVLKIRGVSIDVVGIIFPLPPNPRVGIGLTDLPPCPLMFTVLLYISIMFVVEDNRPFHRQIMSKDEPSLDIYFFVMPVLLDT